MTGRSKFPRAGQNVPQGTQLNNMFEIDELITAGGMGEVYRGHNIQTNDPVAIKIVLPEFAQDEMILGLFRKEARILNHLHHEAIVRYYVFSIDAALGLPFLAMEYVDGPSLAERIKAGPLDLVSVVTLQRHLADGLEKAHQAGVIHRDIAPDNIILPDGQVDRAKIIDFGIARSAAVGGGTLLGGQFAGKYSFVSPEQLGLFGGEVDNRSDIYSLGLVLAACILGRPLNMSGSQVDVIEKRRSVPDLTGIDPPLLGLIEAMLQPDPQDRPQSMAEVADWPTYDEPEPDIEPTRVATSPPTRHLSRPPTRHPSRPPIRQPSRPPTSHPSRPPTSHPSRPPTSHPSRPPTSHPSRPPIRQPSRPPTSHPSQTPTGHTSQPPTGHPSRPPADDLAVKELSRRPSPAAAPQRTRAFERRREKAKPRLGLIAGGIALTAVLLGGLGGWAYVEYWSGAWYQDLSRPAPVATDLPPPIPADDEVVGATDPPEPPEPLFTAADIRDYVTSYDGGSCFFAFPANVGDSRADVVGYGNRREAFETLRDSFQQRFGFEAAIELRQVSDPQCVVVDALGQLTSDGAPQPVLDLNQGVLRSGETLRGTISGLNGRHHGLVMLDNYGLVHNLASFVTREDDVVNFAITLHLEKPGEFEPQLVVSVASAEPLQSLDLEQFAPASEFILSLLEEIASKPEGIGTATGYFKFGS